jgi:hypothetical protein
MKYANKMMLVPFDKDLEMHINRSTNENMKILTDDKLSTLQRLENLRKKRQYNAIKSVATSVYAPTAAPAPHTSKAVDHGSAPTTSRQPPPESYEQPSTPPPPPPQESTSASKQEPIETVDEEDAWARFNTPLRIEETVFDKSARRKSLGKLASSAQRRESLRTIRRVDRMINDDAAEDMDTSILYGEEALAPQQRSSVVQETLVNLPEEQPADTAENIASLPTDTAPAKKRPPKNNISQEEGLQAVHASMTRRKKRKYQRAFTDEPMSQTRRLAFKPPGKQDLKRINLTQNKIFNLSVRDNGENDKYDDSLARARHAIVVGRMPNTINLRTRKPVSVKWDRY